MQIAVFGEELIGFVDMHAKMLGLTQTSAAAAPELTNEQRAKTLIDELGFDFGKINKERVRQLIEIELSEYQEGSSEYIRLLCGYLFCLGDRSDSELLKKVKHSISFDVGCMIDQEWIDSLENGGIQDSNVRSREMLIADFVRYYAVKE
jgi:phosphoribosylglycinamide formyltransferase-1